MFLAMSEPHAGSGLTKIFQRTETTLLVGGIPTPLTNMKASWGYYSQYMEK